jgi:predicted DNA-binding antitoxin AbrB/MazE fold protein
MTVLTTRATYTGGVLKPATKLDLPDGATVMVQISSDSDVQFIDPKDALMEDAATLQAMYAEFAQEDRELARSGLTAYARLLREEERSA